MNSTFQESHYSNIFRYDQALVDANESMKRDPKHKKSLLRRATALLELKKRQQAMCDLRTLLKLEPLNASAQSFMKHLSAKNKMHKKLRSIFVGHFLRRVVIKLVNEKSRGSMGYFQLITPVLFRQTVCY